MSEILKMTLKGLFKMLSKHPLPNWELEMISFKAFTSADADNDNFMDLNETINWMELNEHFIQFLATFEPEEKKEYDDALFEQFPPLDICRLENKILNTR